MYFRHANNTASVIPAHHPLRPTTSLVPVVSLYKGLVFYCERAERAVSGRCTYRNAVRNSKYATTKYSTTRTNTRVRAFHIALLARNNVMHCTSNHDVGNVAGAARGTARKSQVPKCRGPPSAVFVRVPCVFLSLGTIKI